MQMAQQTDVVARAQDFISRAIADARLYHRSRLPSIKQMARLARVSHGVMGRVVARERDQGVLEVCRSRGVLVTLDDAVAPAVTREGSSRRWERLQRQMRADLNAGAYGFNGMLPSRKELQHRYGVSDRTLQRALALMVDDGVLEPFKRSYRGKTHASISARNLIGLFLRGTDTGRIADFTSRNHNCFRAAEQECLAHNTLLRPFPCFFRRPDVMVYVGQGKGRGDEASDLNRFLGFMIWPIVMHQSFLTELMRRLARFDKPVAFFWDNLSPEPVVPAPRSGLVRHFVTQSDFEAGRAMGLYLLSLGHRHIRCFCSDAPEGGWVVRRMAGIRRAFEDAGRAESVTEFNCNINDPSAPNSVDSEPQRRTAAGIAAAAARTLEERSGVHMSQALRADLEQYLRTAGRDALLRGRIEPAFRRALDEREITAWIGMNDVMALECLRFLREHGVDVGREISVAGFDDSAEASFQGLSSYSFNGAAAVHAMVEYLLHPDTADQESDQPYGVEGFVHERGTTGRARNRVK
jgi:DNA-binding LacI/PurR family transcriptional regulator/DNA-binding transcriptional regulator YhcF (GntR family)